MNRHDFIDWCQGCAAERASGHYVPTLPEGWIEGDVIPENVIRHGTTRERVKGQAPFVFTYGKQERILV